MKTKLYLVLCLCYSVLASTSFAAETDNSATTAKTLATPPVTTGALLEMLFGLLLVLSCIAFLAWLLRRTGRFNSTANGEMKIIAGLPLGPRERAVLIQVGEQQILVGVTAQHVQTLHVLDHAVETKNTDVKTHSFAERLQQMVHQRGQT